MGNTGAITDGPCPGCGNLVVGMMPQRCFLCGYDYTEAIKAQNPAFVPDPDYKSPADDAMREFVADDPVMEGAYREMKMEDRYGKEADTDSTAEEVDEDEFASLTQMLNVEMNQRRDVGNHAIDVLNALIDQAAIPPSWTQEHQIAFTEAARRLLPGINFPVLEVSEVWDPFDQKQTRMFRIEAEMTNQRITGININRSVAIDPTEMEQ